VSWTAPATTTSPITGYVVTPYIGSSAQTPFIASSSATSATVAGLTNGTAYTFTVAAVERLGTTPESSASNPVTPNPTSGGAPPGVAFTTQVVDFGSVAVGKLSAPQTVGVSNTGTGTLHVSSVSITGADAGAFAVTADTCSGNPVGGGLGCSATVTFKPTAGGAETAKLSLTDDASGSPQIIELSGSGTTTGTVSGLVVDGSSAGSPVDGAGVEICPQVGSSVSGSCQSTSTGSNGRYDFSGLQAGPWLIQVSSPTSSLFGASAIVQVVAGSQTQNFTLSAPVSLPTGVTINGPFGKSHGGVPTLNWDEPFSMQFTAAFPSEPGGTEIAYFATVALRNSGSGNSAAITSGSLVLLVTYGANGAPSVMSEYPDPDSGPNPTITFSGVAAASVASAAGAPGVGGVLIEYLPTSNELVADVPSVNEKTHGGTSVSIDRSYAVVVDPGSGSQASLAHATAASCKVPRLAGDTLAAAKSALISAHCALGTVTKRNSATIASGRVIASKLAAGTTHSTGTKVGVTLSLGPKTRPKPKPKPKISVRIKRSRISVFGSKTKHVRVIIHFPHDPCDCGNVYYDPSGEVASTSGIPLGGAKVVLLRSASAGGPFGQVPNGSLVMSPSNRRNPDSTNALGHFGWDVATGFYRITAGHPGCSAGSHDKLAETRVYTVPPPVSNLLIKLRCPHLHRSSSRVSLRFRHSHGSIVLVTARVRGRHPAGLITFAAAGLHATVAINSRTRSATLVTTSGATVKARYQGDAENKPSAARGRA